MKILQGTVQLCIATDPFLAIASSCSENARTKCPGRENQWFQRSIQAVHIERDSSSTHLPKTQPSSKKCPELTELLVTSLSLWWRPLISKSDTQIFTPILTTHNLLKNLRRGIRGFSDRYFTQKSASPAGVPRGCFCAERHGCGEARQPP